MDIQKMVKDALEAICNLFSKLQPKAKLATHWASEIVNGIKNFDLQHPDLDNMVLAVLPDKIEDQVKNLLRNEIPRVGVELKILDSGFENANFQEAIVGMATAFQMELSDRAKDAMAHSLSVLLTQILADQKISWSDGVLIAEYYYREHIKTGKPIDEQALINAA